MREGESQYWDGVAGDVLKQGGGSIVDNWPKRHVMLGLLLRYSWIKERVLEIGVGMGMTAATLKMSCGGMWEYMGTDVSEKFCKAASEKWRLNVVQTDILNLPRGTYSRVLALDSLEHVHPEDRQRGFASIAAVMEQKALLFINIPMDDSKHKDKFDHGFNLTDLHIFEQLGLKLMSYEMYFVPRKDHTYSYAMAVLQK